MASYMAKIYLLNITNHISVAFQVPSKKNITWKRFSVEMFSHLRFPKQLYRMVTYHYYNEMITLESITVKAKVKSSYYKHK